MATSNGAVTVRFGPGLFGCVFIVFLVLKLCGTIGWSWWWITAPLWMPVALFFAVAILMLAFMGIAALITTGGKW